jgi:hypothetical protein
VFGTADDDMEEEAEEENFLKLMDHTGFVEAEELVKLRAPYTGDSKRTQERE